MKFRDQLTLFVPPPYAVLLEANRTVLDPVQAKLIAAHVTLCREDEIENLSSTILQARLAASGVKNVTLRFGAPESFSGHGILLPCIAGEREFHALRQLILGTNELRRQAPHITLAYPRNPRAVGNTLANAAKLAQGLSITFTCIVHIRQEGSAPWQNIGEYPLGVAEKGAALYNLLLGRR